MELLVKKSTDPLILRLISGLLMLSGAGVAFWAGSPYLDYLILLLLVLSLYEWLVLCRQAPFPVGKRFLWLVVGAFYLFISFRLFAETAHHTPRELWVIVAAVIATDVGGYFVGKTVGGPKLSPAISPKKTWAGLLGGVIMAVLAGGVVLYSVEAFSTRHIPLLVGLSLVSQLGDLLESWAKRRIGVKDSGTLIPGHGGVLDRLDGFIAVFFLYSLLNLISSLV